MTPQETRLWLRLRALREQGFHFRRQVPVRRFVVDFACLRAGVIVEIDGSQHAEDIHAMRDARRDAELAELGFRVLRFWNGEIDASVDDVAETIFRACFEKS